MMLKRLFSIALLLVALAGCAEPPPPPYKNIDNAQLKTLLAQGMPIYDVRRPDEWRQTGVVEGSRLLTFVGENGRVSPDFLPQFAAAAGKDDPVILICRTGNRTDVLARELMEKHGYTQVYNVRDGITRWIREGNAVVKR